MNEELLNRFKQMIRLAMSYAQDSHDYIFKKNTDPSIAIAYLNVASSKFASAESLYYARIDDLKNNDAETLFHLFDVYVKELLGNFATDHSHQWTDIEFIRLKEHFDHSVFAPSNM